MENILKESKEFKILFEKSMNLLSGMHTSKMKGDGLEFVDLREYVIGDDVRRIDWKVSARENKIFIKEFLEERDVNLYVFLDTSASMKNKFEIGKILSSSLLLSAKKSGDAFSQNFFSQIEKNYSRPSKSKNSLMKFIYEISKKKPLGKGNFLGLAKSIISQIKKKSIICIISDEIEINDKTLSLLSVINHKHDLRVFHIYSSKEKDLSIGLNSFEDSETGENLMYDLNEKEIMEYANEFERLEKNLKNKLLSIGIRPIMIDCDSDLFLQVRNHLGGF